MTTYEIIDLIFSGIWLIIWIIALNQWLKFINNQNIKSQKQTSKWDNSPNVGWNFTQQ